ncbi:hypothetical protein [Burkholderia cenocepacia]|uniref:hypothetical protein n=1 Tax=Burkholderia cenocepacia TaxID=95486 RepID=UPI0028573ED2|nr:hypothetical protein [Burkholderia cenocepacia]MDR8071860.1 hypothetical protein [Burkholderia cenocepacia]
MCADEFDVLTEQRRFKSEPSIIGWNHIPFGKLDALEPEGMMADVAAAALAHAGVDADLRIST